MPATHLEDPWAGLPDNWRTPPQAPIAVLPPLPALPPLPPAPRIPQHERPLPELRLPEVSCHPRCIHCHHPELRCLCDPPVIVCDHTEQPRGRPSAKTGRTVKTTRRIADVCLIRARAAAELTEGREGYQVLVVRDCPHCHNVHVHSSHPNASRYRIGACRQPYVLEIST